METQHPLLTYGIYMPKEDNYVVLENKTQSEELLDLTGFDMYYDVGSPRVITGTGSIKTNLVTLKEESYNKVLNKMDWLLAVQDEKSINKRVLHTFTYEGKEIQAWIYINEKARISRNINPEKLISDGDWAKDKAERKLRAKTA